MGRIPEKVGFVAFGVSLGLHAAVGIAISASPVLFNTLSHLSVPHEAPTVPPQPLPEPVPETPEVVRPGIAASDSASITWIGFAEATDQAAPRSETDQSAMTTAANGATAKVQSPVSDPAPDDPAPAPIAAAQAPERDEPKPESDAGLSPPVVDSDKTAAPGQVTRGEADQDHPRESPPSSSKQPATIPDTRATPANSPAPTPPPEPTPETKTKPADDAQTPKPVPAPDEPIGPAAPPQPAPAPPAQETPKDDDAKPVGLPQREPVATSGLPGPLPFREANDRSLVYQPNRPKPADTKAGVPQRRSGAPAREPFSGKPGKPAEQADKDADATSIEKAVEYRDGKVKAGQGLDIRTVAPEFDTFTRVTAAPRNPVAEVSFDQRGGVIAVRFLVGSGYKDVDEPIRHALWGWTAKGKAIDDLAGKPKGSVVKLSFRILLRS